MNRKEMINKNQIGTKSQQKQKSYLRTKQRSDIHLTVSKSKKICTPERGIKEGKNEVKMVHSHDWGK